MIVGCLGDVVFQVSESVVETIKDMEWSGSARYAVHQRHLQNALTEFTGVDPDEIKFSVTLTTAFGVSIIDELVKIWTYERSGAPVPLVIGEKPYGKYRWNIVKHSAKYTQQDKRGNPLVAELSLELQEYLGG